MKREEMRKIIKEELKHILRGPRGSDQNMLRVYYNGMRMTDLSQNPACPAKETLTRAIEEFRKDHPYFMPIYERDFFHI